jgi:hypothetical protein
MRISAKGRMVIVLLAILFQTNRPSFAADGQNLKFTVRDAPWTLSLTQGGLTVDDQQIQPNGKAGYFLLHDQKAAINVSFYIEPTNNCTTSRDCRDMVWKLGNPGWENPQNVVLSEYGDTSIVEFLVPSFKGVPVNQQNIYAEFVVNGYWVDLHVSKVAYKPADHDALERIVRSIMFELKQK